MRVDDDQQQNQAPPGAPAPDGRPAEEPAAEDVTLPTQRAHAGWGPPEYYTPDGDRRDEPPGPVATDEPVPTGSDEPAEPTGSVEPAEPTGSVEPAGSLEPAEPVASAEPAEPVGSADPAEPVGSAEPDAPAADVAPPETVPADVPDVEDVDAGEFPPDDAGAGTTYGQPVPADEVSTGEPVVGVAQVPDGTAFWEAGAVDGYRERWQQIQLRFIDDPRQAAAQAQALVSDVLDGFTAAVSRQRDELNRWESAEPDDTEELRVTVRRYRDLLDRLLDL